MVAMFVVEPRKGGLFDDRTSPEFLTLVAVAVALGVGIAARLLKRSTTRG